MNELELLRKQNRIPWRNQRIIVNPADLQSVQGLTDPKSGEVVGISYGFPITTSEHVEKGTAYLIKDEQPKPFPKLELLEMDNMNRFVVGYFQNWNPTSIFDTYPSTLQDNRWQRRFGEKILNWGNRLEQEGYWDIPDIRWEYSCEMWRTIAEYLANILMTVIHITEETFERIRNP